MIHLKLTQRSVSNHICLYLALVESSAKKSPIFYFIAFFSELYSQTLVVRCLIEDKFYQTIADAIYFLGLISNMLSILLSEERPW